MARTSSPPRRSRRSATTGSPTSELTLPPLDSDAVAPPTGATPSAPKASHVVDVASRHLGEPYAFGARAPMADSTWAGPWDCAEFVSWCLYQATGILYGTRPSDDPVMADAYTGFWAEQAERDGATVPTMDAVRIEGACLLRKPRGRTIGHIAFSTGDGKTVEAHSRARGVARHTASGRAWDYGVLVPGIVYFLGEQAIAYRPPASLLRVTTPLTRGPGVAELQNNLARFGFKPGPIDGIYGPQTAAAVMAFQIDSGLVPDGEVGPETQQALRLAARPRRPRSRRNPRS